MARSLIAFGGNLGEPLPVFRGAVESLNEAGGRIAEVSSLYETAPVGEAAGATFLNGALIVETGLSPVELLRELKRIEAAAGRQTGARWGPRPIDLDIALYEDLVLDTPELTLPHPGCVYRRFLLDPAVEIAADWPHPTLTFTLAELLSRLRERPLPLGAEPTLIDGLRSAAAPFDAIEVVSTSESDVALYLTAERQAQVAGDPPLPTVALASVPGDQAESIRSILTAATDIPQIRYDRSWLGDF